MNILQLYQDYGIQYATEGHKHCRPGWVNTVCPFCTGNPGYHLGYDLINNHFVCWRCGGHGLYQTIAALTHAPSFEISAIIRKYKGIAFRAEKIKVVVQSFILPTNLETLSKQHKQYLINRNFDPEKIERIWKIQGTGMHSKLGKQDWKWRIFVPIYWENKIQTFLGRSLSNDKDGKRYLVCPETRALINIKHTLYGREDKWGKSIVVVEGVTDVWRLGIGAVALYGIKYKLRQVRELKKRFKRIHIVFDDDPQAQQQALKLQAELKILGGVEAIIHTITGDPGSMTDDDAKHLMKQLR